MPVKGSPTPYRTSRLICSLGENLSELLQTYHLSNIESWARALREKAWQSRSAHAVRSSRLGRIGQDHARGMGALRAQVVDRGGQTPAAPQRAGDCARQQASPHCLGCSPQGTRLRVRQDQCDFGPSRLIIAPCSGPSRRGLETLAQAAASSRRPALTAPARDAPVHPQAGTKERPLGTNKGTDR